MGIFSFSFLTSSLKINMRCLLVIMFLVGMTYGQLEDRCSVCMKNAPNMNLRGLDGGEPGSVHATFEKLCLDVGAVSMSYGRTCFMALNGNFNELRSKLMDDPIPSFKKICQLVRLC